MVDSWTSKDIPGPLTYCVQQFSLGLKNVHSTQNDRTGKLRCLGMICVVGAAAFCSQTQHPMHSMDTENAAQIAIECTLYLSTQPANCWIHWGCVPWQWSPLPRQHYATSGGFNLRGFFFRMTKIKGAKNWYCSLEMKGKFGVRTLAAASEWMFIVDSGWALDGCCWGDP